MKNPTDKSYPLLRVEYDKGDLIMKEGDYGTSIYKIRRGKVGIFKRVGGGELAIAEATEGDVIGETALFHNGTRPRPMSARALEDCELEVWHPSEFMKEYDKMPPLLKYIFHQTSIRLVRMNKVIEKISPQEEKKETAKAESFSEKRGEATQRLYYRKKLDVHCTYRPLNSPTARLEGQIKDISLGGLGVDIPAKNLGNSPHEQGKIFYVDTVLPNGKPLNVSAKIVRIEKDAQTAGRYWMGMEFTHLTDEDSKNLGFFLMP